MKFAQDFIDRVAAATNLVDLVSGVVQLKRSGHQWQGLCPFHNEKSPSFSVSDDKQVYHCFGCKKGGNAFTFVQDTQGLTFPEAVEYLAQRAGLAIPEDYQPGHDGKKDLQKKMFAANEVAARYFHDELLRLPRTHAVHEYLRRRGLNEEAVNKYCIGYAPDSADALLASLRQAQAPASVAVDVGLLKPSKIGRGGYYPLFRQRLMFPIYSPTGRCLGFGGRVLGKELPKYINSPDSAIFHKGQVFYGLDQSAKFIRTNDMVIVVEGYMDWLALVGAGIRPVVATLGTALTPEHARLIKKYTRKVVVMFDGDEAGRRAAERSLSILLAEELHPKGLYLPNDLDPDDFVRQRGAQALEALVARAPDLFDLVLEEQLKELKGDATQKVAVIDQMAPVLMAAADGRLRELYAQHLAERLEVDFKLVAKSLQAPQARPKIAVTETMNTSAVKAPGTPPPPQTTHQVIKLEKVPSVEVELLNVSLLKEVYLIEALSSGVVSELSHKGMKELFTRIGDLYGQMPSKFDKLTVSLITEVEPAELLSRHLAEPYRSLDQEGAKKLLHDCIRRIRQNFLRGKSKELMSNLRANRTQDPSKNLEQIMNIQRSRHDLEGEN